ncbi:hypothetical protein [Amycolatopsis japonica]
MSFEVEPDALDKFAGLLDQYGYDTTSLSVFMSDGMRLGLQGEGLMSYLIGGHERLVEAMGERVSLMDEVSGDSADGIRAAAALYRDTDTAHAEYLDGTYSDAKEYDEPTYRHGAPKTPDFTSHPVEDELKLDKKPSELEPKVDKMMSDTRDLIDSFSLAGPLRDVLTWLCGDVDPIDWVRSWWLGDWTAWAKAALTWDACGDAIGVMGDNLQQGESALGTVWEGKAADQAAYFFKKFRDATYTEQQAHKALYEAYKLIMEMIFEINQAMNDALNTIIDIGLTLLAAPVKGGNILRAVASRPDLVWQAVQRFGDITMYTTASMDVVEILETIDKTVDFVLDNPLPPCELPTMTGVDSRYEHPDENIWKY